MFHIDSLIRWPKVGERYNTVIASDAGQSVASFCEISPISVLLNTPTRYPDSNRGEMGQRSQWYHTHYSVHECVAVDKKARKISIKFYNEGAAGVSSYVVDYILPAIEMEVMLDNHYIKGARVFRTRVSGSSALYTGLELLWSGPVRGIMLGCFLRSDDNYDGPTLIDAIVQGDIDNLPVQNFDGLLPGHDAQEFIGKLGYNWYDFAFKDRKAPEIIWVDEKFNMKSLIWPAVGVGSNVAVNVMKGK